MAGVTTADGVSAPPRRYRDRGTPLAGYADEVLVRCRRCDAPGCVRVSWQPYAWRGSFHCARCGLALDLASRDWVGPLVYVGHRACGQCGHRWLAPRVEEHSLTHVRHTHVEMQCPACRKLSAVPVKAHPLFPADHAIDPHFGHPLRLVETTRHGVVWAYNARHLTELRAYVSALLRERRGSTNRSLISRLPRWIKLAKHRDIVLKALDRLAAQLVQLQASKTMDPRRTPD